MIIGPYYINFTKHARLSWTQVKAGPVRLKPWHKPYAYHIGWGRFSLWLERDECGCRWSDNCQECCEHEYDSSEGYHCLNCRKDGSEDVASATYERYKDSIKYGD
jgi:hypothetical protein